MFLIKWIFRRIERLLIVALAIAGAACAGQFPNYIAQYLQRMGGHIDEATIILEKYNINQLQSRIDSLNLSFKTISSTKGIKQVRAFIKYMDKDIAQNTWRNFTPGMTFNSDGIYFMGVGAISVFIVYEFLAFILGLIFRGLFKKKPQPQQTSKQVT